MGRCLVRALFLIALLLLPAPLWAKNYSGFGRDIGCAKMDAGRAQKICEAIATSLEWQWFGHGTIAAGYKPSFAGIRRTYCAMKISKADVVVLEKLRAYDFVKKDAPDWRLESGATILLKIVSNLDGLGDEPETSIYNPQNKDYILKGGCG